MARRSTEPAAGGRRHRSLLLLVVGAVLLTGCFPIDPERQEGVDRGVAAASQLAQAPGFEVHGQRLQAAMAALAAVPAVRDASERLGAAQLELIGTPRGARATELAAEIEAISTAIITEPTASAEVAEVRAALQVLRDDVPTADLADAAMRGYADAMRPPTGRYIPKVGVFGDSAGLSLVSNSLPYTSWSNPDKKLAVGAGYVTLGCGTLIHTAACGTPEEWGARAADGATDVALVYAGWWETWCWQFDDWTECHHLGEPIFDDYIRRNLDARTEALLAAGVPKVVYVLSNDRRLDVDLSTVDPEQQALYLEQIDRWERWYELVREHAARYDHVEVLDLVPWWRAHPERDVALRPDGLHFTDTAWEFWRDVLEPELYWDLWLPRFGRRGHRGDPWVPVLGPLWAETTPPPAITGPGLSTTTTTSPPTTSSTTTTTTTAAP